MYSPSSELPGHSRIWIYQCSRELTGQEIIAVSERTMRFLESWTAHDLALKAGFEIRYNRFLILMIDEKTAGASGCSIDKSVHFIQSLEKELNTSLLERMQFALKRNNRVEVVSKKDFEKMFSNGELSGESIVFNNLIETKADLSTRWEIPLNESWHKNLVSN